MRTRALIVLPLIAACSGESNSEPRDPYSNETLAEYLQALPEQERLNADLPTALDTPGALMQPGNAVLAAQGVAFARAVNQPVRVLVAALRRITSFSPTRYDAAA